MQGSLISYMIILVSLLNSGCGMNRDTVPAGTDPDETGSVPAIPHVHSAEPAPVQPQEVDTSVIWYDDFSVEKAYLEAAGGIDYTESFGKEGGAMRAGFRQGAVEGEGNRKVAFGDFPAASGVVRKTGHFDEIYWRFYVCHEYGWQGAPGKMTRATSIVSPGWQQSMIVHLWSGEGNSITLDPASGVYGQTDSIRTTKYNDFDKLSWLGNKPGSQFQISSVQESGYWVSVEVSVKLNTPGKADGSCRLWIDGLPDGERTGLNLRGSYTKHGINAVFLESYWNSGAVKTEGRWFDNFVISSCPVGPVTCLPNPRIYKTPYHGPGSMKAWELEIAADRNGNDVVYRSRQLSGAEDVRADTQNGEFTGSAGGKTSLGQGTVYVCRVRQQSSNGRWSEWSRWHQPFRVQEP